MAKISIRDIARLPVTPDVPPALEPEGAVRIRAAFARDADPIHLYGVDLDQGGAVTIHGLERGCVVYMFAGAVSVEARDLDRGSIFVVEHGAALQAICRAPDTTLLVFAVGEACHRPPSRAGGHVHILPSGDVPRCDDFYGDGRVGGAVLADAACPTCELWLHESALHWPGFPTPIHSHNEDEVIVVTKGEVVLGARNFGPGTAIAVARQTLYGFKAGSDGVTFINFRPAKPIYVPADPEAAEMDERAHYLRHMPEPVAATMASPI